MTDSRKSFSLVGVQAPTKEANKADFFETLRKGDQCFLNLLSRFQLGDKYGIDNLDTLLWT